MATTWRSGLASLAVMVVERLSLGVEGEAATTECL